LGTGRGNLLREKGKFSSCPRKERGERDIAIVKNEVCNLVERTEKRRERKFYGVGGREYRALKGRQSSRWGVRVITTSERRTKGGRKKKKPFP